MQLDYNIKKKPAKKKRRRTQETKEHREEAGLLTVDSWLFSLFPVFMYVSYASLFSVLFFLTTMHKLAQQCVLLDYNKVTLY